MTQPRTVTSQEVDAYRAMVEAQAFRFSRLPEMQNDYDDFANIGRIAVWKTLRAGFRPSKLIVEQDMQDWAKLRRRQMHGESALADDESAS
jgi:hypothetical protein